MSSQTAQEIMDAHALEFANRTDEQWWASIEDTFNLWRDIFEMPLETRVDAIGKKILVKEKNKEVLAWRRTTPVWADELNEGVFEDNHIPYNEAIDREELQELLQFGKELIPCIRESIEKRELTLQFLSIWGDYQACVGALRIIIRSDTYVGPSRAGVAGGEAVAKEGHRRWFAHYFLRYFKGRGSRERTEAIMENLINAIIDEAISVPGINVEWFEEFLYLDAKKENYLTLIDAYREKKLSIKAMKELVKQGSDGIPPVDIEFPAT